MTKNLIAAAVQWAPEVLDLERGLLRARDAMAEAASNGAQIAVFPETWLLGYPYWASISVRDPRFTEARRRLQQLALTRDGEAMRSLQKAAADAGIAVVMGLHERDGGSIYNVAAYISADGQLLNLHRKLMPTNTERLVWGQGDGSDMQSVEMSGAKVNGLICFEHQMTLARNALAIKGVQVHAALWPGHAFINGVIDASTRHIAHENGLIGWVNIFPISATNRNAGTATAAARSSRRTDPIWSNPFLMKRRSFTMSSILPASMMPIGCSTAWGITRAPMFFSYVGMSHPRRRAPERSVSDRACEHPWAERRSGGGMRR